MRTQRPTRGETQLITMILSILYRNNHFREFSVRIMGGKGRKPEFGHQLKSNQYHPPLLESSMHDTQSMNHKEGYWPYPHRTDRTTQAT